MNTLQNVYDRLADKTELAKHEVNLADLASFQKAVTLAETALDKVTPSRTKAKDALTGYKVDALTSLRAYDDVLKQYAELQKLARQIGLELPPNAKADFDRATYQSGVAKKRYNSVDKLIAGLAD
ncbi:MAG: hypothetical protein EBT39_03540 [Sphingobacteriia bacterium]|nr:hypothetical protein [Candidatus Fonsibacter lacus]